MAQLFQRGTSNGHATTTALKSSQQTKQPSVSSQQNTTNIFPGLDEKYVTAIEESTKNLTGNDKRLIQQKMYSDLYSQQKREKELNQRYEIEAQEIQHSTEVTNTEQKTIINTQIKAQNLADMIRSKYGIDVSAGDDNKVIQKFVSQVDNGDQLLTDYLNGKSNKLLSDTGLVSNVFSQLEDKNKVSMTSNADVSVDNQSSPTESIMESTSHFDDPEYSSRYLKQQGSEYSDFINASREAGYNDEEIAATLDAIKTYQDFYDRGLGDKLEELNVSAFQGFTDFFVNGYNNLFGNNPYVSIAPSIDTTKTQFTDDLLGVGNNYGNLRAQSGWSDAGKIVGDLAANIGLMALIPGFSTEGLTTVAEKAGYGAIEGGLGGALGSVGLENADADTVGTTMVGGAIAGGLLGGAIGGAPKLYRFLKSSSLNKETKVANSILGAYQDGIKPTSRGIKTNTQQAKYNNDVINSIEYITKNKANLKYVDGNGEEIVGELPKTVDEFAQAIKQSKDDVYSAYNQIAKEAGKESNVDTTDIVKELKNLKNNKEWLAGQDQGTITRINKWIDDLEKINNNMSVEGAQAKTQELNQKLTAFIKNGNPNDVGSNSVDALVNNGLKKGIDNTIENAGLDSDAYIELKKIYGSLKNIESDVNHRAVVYGRQNPESLVDSISDLSSIDAISDVLKDPVKGTIKLIGSQAKKVAAKSKNNPNNMVKDIFNTAEKQINKTSSLKTSAQRDAELSEKNTTKRENSIRNARKERITSKEQLTRSINQKKAEQQALYDEYLKSKGVGSETKALPSNEGVNNYNTIITNDSKKIISDAEGNAVREGQIGEKISGKIYNPDYNSFRGISEEILDNNGITLDVLGKNNLGGKPYVAVSPYPNRSKIIDVNNFSDKDIFDYFEANADKLFDDGYALGGRVNDGKVYLDVSVALPKEMQNEAIDIANKYNQKAIFDLETFEDIPTGGNGEFMEVNEEEIAKYIKSLFSKNQ